MATVHKNKTLFNRSHTYDGYYFKNCASKNANKLKVEGRVVISSIKTEITVEFQVFDSQVVKTRPAKRCACSRAYSHYCRHVIINTEAGVASRQSESRSSFSRRITP